MFITENKNYIKSELFLSAAKQSLKNIIEVSNVSKKNSLVNFIMKEANSYEVMNLLIRGTLPQHKSNDLDELYLYSTLKEQIIHNIDFISEYIDVNTLAEVITEVGSPNISGNLLWERNNDHETRKLQQGTMSKVAAPASGVASGAKNMATQVAQRELVGKGMEYAGKGAKAVGQAGKQVGSAVSSAAQKGATQVAQTARNVAGSAPVQAARKGMADRAAYIKQQMAPETKKLQQQFKKSKAHVGDQIKHGASVVKKNTTDTANQIGTAAQKVAQKSRDVAGSAPVQAAKQRVTQAGQTVSDTATKVGAAAKKYAGQAGTAVSGTAAKTGAAVQSAIPVIQAKAATASQAVSTALGGPVGMSIGGAALGALAIYGAAKTYKRFFSQAAKACSNLSGVQKTACMNKFKVQAITKQIQDLKTSMSGCAKVKNPEKCKLSIEKKVRKLQDKANKVGK